MPFAGDNITVNGIKLPNVSYTKFLGIWIDSKLTWSAHLSKLQIKLKQNLYMLRVGKHCLSTHAKKCLYYAQVYSHINYGLIVWGNMAPKVTLNKLQKIQNKCFKLIYGEEASIANFHNKRIMRIPDIITLLNLKHSHKVQHLHLPNRVLACSQTDITK